MDQTQLAVSNQQLVFLLSNPFTFGALLSWFCEQIPWFKNPKNSDWLKFSVVIAACFAWATFRAILDKDGWLTTVAEWKAVVVTGIAVATSTQIANVLLPGLVDLLKGLKAAPATVTATTASTSTTFDGNTTTTTSAATEKTETDTPAKDTPPKESSKPKKVKAAQTVAKGTPATTSDTGQLQSGQKIEDMGSSQAVTSNGENATTSTTVKVDTPLPPVDLFPDAKG